MEACPDNLLLLLLLLLLVRGIPEQGRTRVRGARPLQKAWSLMPPLPALQPHRVLHLEALPVPEDGPQPPQESQAACLRFIHQHLCPGQQGHMCVCLNALSVAPSVPAFLWFSATLLAGLQGVVVFSSAWTVAPTNARQFSWLHHLLYLSVCMHGHT